MSFFVTRDKNLFMVRDSKIFAIILRVKKVVPRLREYFVNYDTCSSVSSNTRTCSGILSPL